MAIETVDLLETPISRLDLAAAVSACEARARSGQGGYVCFVNVHSLTESTRSSELRDVFEGAFACFPDGMPLVWVSRWKGRPVGSRVCGPDFMESYLSRNREELQGFIGGRPGQAEKLAARFGVPAVCLSPPMRDFTPENASEDWRAFLKLCPGGKAPRVIWLGLGAPKQELWMRTVSRLAPETLFFGVGAAFDFFSGEKTRAPDWMRKSGLEWAHRLMSEPGRLWKRYLVTNTRFALLATGDVIRSKRSR